jgi:tetratricopeptide (TPR) repeat protein
MILTNCAACAAPLRFPAKQCGRCKTRYCGPACQKQHWDAGHKDFCKKIKKVGGAEQYNANNKYAEAVSVAAEACAEDTKGQTCYICTQALHWKTKEGLVRGCSCRGTAGFAHVSCLAEQAKILVAEAEENNLGAKAFQAAIERWHACSLCEQKYHGVVKCALGWACWKTYSGRPEADWTRLGAMSLLGNGLSAANQHEEALSVEETELSMLRRVGASEERILGAQGNLASTYAQLGREEEALRMRRDVYSGRLKLHGEEHNQTLFAAYNCANLLVHLERYAEAKALLRKVIPVARRALGENNDMTLRIKWNYAMALYDDADASLDDQREAVNTFEDTEQTARRVLGGAHPTTELIERSLHSARAALRARGDVESVREAVAAMTPPGRTRKFTR